MTCEFFSTISTEKLVCCAAPCRVLLRAQPKFREALRSGMHEHGVEGMNWYRRFAKSILDSLERSGRARALAALERMDPDLLREHGFSPELLRHGLRAWPWRLKEVGEPNNPVPVDEIRRAENELGQYSDAELTELGFSRSDIPRVVRRGRPGVDDQAA